MYSGQRYELNNYVKFPNGKEKTPKQNASSVLNHIFIVFYSLPVAPTEVRKDKDQMPIQFYH